MAHGTQIGHSEIAIALLRIVRFHSNKSGTELDYLTSDTLQTFTVKRSKVQNRAWRNVSAV